jgi:predicted GNAT family N-acyltransferase
MDYSIKKFNSVLNPGLEKIALDIRTEVFVKGQHVDPALEYEFEEESNHYLLFAGDKALSTARWRETPKGIKLERFATLPDFRNKGFGSIILKEILSDIIPLKKTIYLHSQDKAVRFYERHGFEISGDLFIEAYIRHYPMVFKGPVPASPQG